MTQIQCECGKFRAELTGFPKNSPGRLMCYCDDCQTYLHYLGRADLLDANGGTELIPAYPSEYKIISGKEFLKCTRIHNKGMYRWSTTCCNTPVANTRPNSPWIGNLSRIFSARDPSYLEKTFGAIKSRILGKFAKGTPPEGTPKNMDFNAVRAVMPFMLKGLLTKKSKNSPFFEEDGTSAIAEPRVLSAPERNAVRERIGFSSLSN